MKIIIGLGNPEKKYDNTRHNLGFLMVDKIKTSWNFPEWEMNKKFNAEMTEGFLPSVIPSNVEGSNKIILVKPQTFMNRSGESVRELLAFYKSIPEDIIVIHDDLDIVLGKYRLATDSSSAGHNGVQNIIEQLGTQEFHRIRIGIGEEKENAPVCKIDAHNFVLEKFSSEELEKISEISNIILEEIKKLL